MPSFIKNKFTKTQYPQNSTYNYIIHDVYYVKRSLQTILKLNVSTYSKTLIFLSLSY